MLYYFKAFFDYVWTRRSEWYTYMQQQGFFVDRGDPAALDFVEGDFIKDNAWHDLDLSAIVPEHAKCVLFSVLFKANATERVINFRRDGNVNPFNYSSSRSQVANIRITQDLSCPISTNRKLEYQASPLNIILIRMTVKGWWF